MADGGQQRALTAAFPPPPPFWKHFTPENIQKLEEIKQEAAKKEDGKPNKKWSPAELRALDVPSELRFLVPPEIPSSGYYSVFGELQSVCFSSALEFCRFSWLKHNILCSSQLRFHP